MGGDAGVDEFGQCGAGDFAAQNDKGLGNFTGLFIGDADDGGIGDGGVAEKKAFELGGRDLEAFEFDEFFAAVDDTDQRGKDMLWGDYFDTLTDRFGVRWMFSFKPPKEG